MEFVNLIFRPDTFETGGRYLLKVRNTNGRRPFFKSVTFVRYDACPAIVVVSDGEEQFLRVGREDLYSWEMSIRE